mmetsp:Transcript_41008/g.89606  ORF Transcript_41008/g.89606 Transcript_41008/m.89606 type:complete len:117 (-) Transcript_41008:1553-1903(-)
MRVELAEHGAVGLDGRPNACGDMAWAAPRPTWTARPGTVRGLSAAEAVIVPSGAEQSISDWRGSTNSWPVGLHIQSAEASITRRHKRSLSAAAALPPHSHAPRVRGDEGVWRLAEI